MRKFLLAVFFMIVWTGVALACTGYLTGEQVVRLKSGRDVRVCSYDHLGEPLSITISTVRFCPTMINVKHQNEDRDGDGEEDIEQ